MNDPYERLAAALDALPNGFPRTPGGKEIRILQKIFSPEEAFLASQLGREMELPTSVAARVGLPVDQVASRLKALAKRGMVWPELDRQARSWRFRLAPFVVGMYEASLELMDHELAHLVEDYMAEGGAEGIMKPEPPLARVVPGRHSLPTEWVLPYEDVVKILERSKTFSVRDCICRVQQGQLGRKCDFPIHTCLTFSGFGRPPGPKDISRSEALAILDQCEEVGLVHTVSNVVQDLYYVCNCCGCCCGILRGITERGIQRSVARASYIASVDTEKCTGCLACVKRCQVQAITDIDGDAVVDRARCIGCGLCVTGCPAGAASLHKRPDWEEIRPPETFAEWEHQRLHNRLLAVAVDDPAPGKVVGG